MIFSQIAMQLGIETYPQRLDRIYTQTPVLPVKRQMLCRWQEEMQLFGEFFPDVLRGFDELQEKSAELAWTATVCAFLQTATRLEARALQLPTPDGSCARDMIPLFLLLSRLEWAMAEYEKRGYTQAQIRELMEVFVSDIRATRRNTGRPGVNKTYYDWISLIMYCILLPCRGFKFDIRKAPKAATLLRNKSSAATVVLVHGMQIHKSGHRLGTAGCTDEEGAFMTALEETETAFVGNAANDAGLVSPEKRAFPKSDWEVAVRPEDDVLGIHIPRGADIRPEKVFDAVEGVLEHIKQYYPEYHIKAIHCSSWMLNPELGALVGQQSKLATFSDLFRRYPTVSNGKAVFGFVFGKGSDADPETLPEDTRLQRTIKKRYLDGGYIHAFNGFMVSK